MQDASQSAVSVYIEISQQTLLSTGSSNQRAEIRVENGFYI